MKLRTLLCAGALLLGLSACRHEELPEQQTPSADAVTGLEVTEATYTSIALKWEVSETVAYVMISYSREGQDVVEIDEKITETSYVVDGLTFIKDSPYEFTVTSYNEKDEKGDEAKVQANVLQETRDVPSVTFLTASNVSQTTATFKWGQPKGVAYAIVNFERKGDHPMQGSERVDDRVFALTDVYPDDENPLTVTVIGCDEDGFEAAPVSLSVICGGTKNYNPAV